MNKYLVVKLKSNWAKENILPRIEKNGFKYVPFWGDKIHLDLIKEHDIVIFSVENTINIGFEEKDHFFKGAAEYLLFDGIPYFHGAQTQTLGWAESINRELNSKGANSFYETTSGNYNLVKISNEGEITAFGDFLGFNPVFYLENEDVCAISNRQMLLNGICTKNDNLTFDIFALSMISGQANVIGNDSVFSQVKLLSPGNCLKLRPNKATFELEPFRLQYTSTENRELNDSDFDEITDILIKQANSLANLPTQNLTMSLTGGKDSRLVLALALKSDLIKKIDHVFTNGREGSPEVECAAFLAEKMGVPHVAKITKPSVFNLAQTWELLRYHVYRFEGSVCPWDGLGSPANSSRLELNGMGGEIFRTGQVKHHSKIHLTTLEEACHLMEDYQQKTDPLNIQHNHITLKQKQFLRDLTKKKHQQGVPLNDISISLYVDNRLTMWSGLIATNTFAMARIFPLVNLKAVNIAFQGGYQQRQMDRFHFEIMRRLNRELTELPFLKDTWDERLKTYIEKAKLNVATEGFKTALAVDSKNMVSWQWDFVKEGWEEISEVLLGSPNSGLFDIVCQNRLEEVLLNRDAYLKNVISVKQILSLLEIQLLLTGGFLRKYEGNTQVTPEIDTNIPNLNLKLGSVDSFSLFKSVKAKSQQCQKGYGSFMDAASNHSYLLNKENLETAAASFKSEELIGKLKLSSLEFALPLQKISKLRLDPSNQICEFILGKIELDIDGTKTIITIDGKTGLQPNKNVEVIKSFEEYTLYRGKTGDPFFLFNDFAEVDLENANSASLKVELIVSTAERAELFMDLGDGFSEKSKLVQKIKVSVMDLLVANSITQAQEMTVTV